jgi:hypothetical protein
MKNYVVEITDSVNTWYHNSSLYKRSMNILYNSYVDKRVSRGSSSKAWVNAQLELKWFDKMVITFGSFLDSIVVKHKYASYITEKCSDKNGRRACCVDNVFPQIGVINRPAKGEYDVFLKATKTEE